MAVLNAILLINQYFKYFKKRRKKFKDLYTSNLAIQVKTQPHIEIFFSIT